MRRAAAATPGFGAALLGLLAVLGCGAHPHRGLWSGVDLEEERGPLVEVPAALARLRPLPALAVLVSYAAEAPSATALPATATAEAVTAEGEEVAFDPGLLGAELLETLDTARLFKSVIALRQEGALDIGRAKDQARKSRASLLLTATVGARALRRLDRPLFLPSVIWLCTGPLVWWYHDQTWELQLHVRFRLFDLNAGGDCPELPLEPGRARDVLDFHERTGSLWVYLLPNLIPAPLCPVDGDEIARTLAPAAAAGPVSQFLTQVADWLNGDVYTFRTQTMEGGPTIRLVYPPADPQSPVLVRKGEQRYSFLVEPSRPGATIREVRMSGDGGQAGAYERVFPKRSEPGAVVRRRLPVERKLPVTAGGSILIEAVDSTGASSRVLVFPVKRAGR
jgi:hypothetical protein